VRTRLGIGTIAPMRPRFRSFAPAALLLAALSPAPARAASAAPFRFQPFVDVAEYPPPDLGAIRAHGGVRHVTLGFITASGGKACTATWGGYSQYPGAGPHAYRLAQVRAFRRGSNDVVVSFGGQAGSELATVCHSDAALSKAYAGVIKGYGATHIDFDVEGSAVTNRAADTRRAQVVAALQRAAVKRHKKLVVTYTLPVLPSGLDGDGLAVVRNAVAHGVRLAAVNGMAMDYGAQAAPHPAGRMGTYAIAVGTGLHRQLGKVFPKLSSAAVWRRVGVTPMLGVNDVETEVFTLADARKLVAFAKKKHLGMLAMWSLGRDRPCSPPTSSTSSICSSVGAPAWAFSKALGAFRG
jgi:hypothetical protein